MKKLFLFAAVLLLPLAAFAQGRVNFANALYAIQTNLSVGPANFSATPLRIGLFIGPAGEVNPQNLTLAMNNVGGSPAWATNQPSPFAGLFNGGSNFQIQGNAWTPISFQIRAWSLAYTTYEEALIDPAAWRGASAIGTVTPTLGITPIPNLFGTGAGQVGAFQVYQSYDSIPEPSSIALGLLGVGVLAFLRRRK